MNFLDNYTKDSISSDIDTILKGGEPINLFPDFIENKEIDNNSRAFLSNNSNNESIINTDFLNNFYFPKDKSSEISVTKTYSNNNISENNNETKLTKTNTMNESSNTDEKKSNDDDTSNSVIESSNIDEKQSISNLSETSTNLSSSNSEIQQSLKVGGDVNSETSISIDLPSEIGIELSLIHI